MRVWTAECELQEKKKSEGTEKPSLEIFDKPIPLFPNHYPFGFHDDNQMDGSFAQNSYILSRTAHEKILVKFYWNILFVCIEILWPSQPNGVMSSAVSLPNHTFTGQA